MKVNNLHYREKKLSGITPEFVASVKKFIKEYKPVLAKLAKM